MEARVCVGGAGAGAEPTPPDTHTLSPPTGAQRPRPPFFARRPLPPGAPHPPRLSHHHRRPDPAGPPRPAPLPKPGARCLPGPPAGCRGYNGAAEKRDLTFHGGRGGETPSPGLGAPSPRPAPRLSGKKRATGQRMVISRPEAASLRLLLSPVSCAPSPNASRGCQGGTGPPAIRGGMDVEGGHRVSPSPSPLNNERT